MTERRAARVTFADGLERVDDGPVDVAVPGVLILYWISGIEDDSLDPIGMPNCESLCEKSAVGIAIEVDPRYGERVEDGCHVVGGERRAEEIGRVTELLAAESDVGEIVPFVGLESGQSIAAEEPVPRLSTSSSWRCDSRGSNSSR